MLNHNEGSAVRFGLVAAGVLFAVTFVLPAFGIHADRTFEYIADAFRLS